MKRFFTAVIFSLIALSVYGQSAKTIDRALMEASVRIDERLESRTIIAVINFTSTSNKFSADVIDELIANLLDSGKLRVVDRKDLDLIRNEMSFQMSGEVSDESMQSIGKMLGAQSIVSGSFTETAGAFRMVIRVLNVETGEIEVQYRTDIARDKRLNGFFPIERTTGEKIGTGSLNILLGLGSYLEGDIAGGITLTAGYALSAGLIILEITALDWDSPMVGVPITAGVSIAGLTLVYGFVRPFIYNRSPQMAYILDNTQSGIVMTSDKFGNNALAFQLSYSIKF